MSNAKLCYRNLCAGSGISITCPLSYTKYSTQGGGGGSLVLLVSCYSSIKNQRNLTIFYKKYFSKLYMTLSFKGNRNMPWTHGWVGGVPSSIFFCGYISTKHVIHVKSSNPTERRSTKRALNRAQNTIPLLLNYQWLGYNITQLICLY